MRRNEIDSILNQLLERHPNLSDINITVGMPFQAEVDGQLLPVQLQPPVLQLTPFQTEALAINLLQGNPKLLRQLLKSGSCDCSYYLGMKARFRVNIFSQRGCYSIVLRKLSTHIPSIAELKFPPVFYRMAEERNGLLLITGATGSGKSTSLAALLRHVNENKAIHVITLEDPIEYEHRHAKATFNQRELGNDFISFAEGLRAALRQAPKVILVGEMRDRETIEIGLSAAETGHLVMSTLHTIDAGQAVNRLVGMFDIEEEQLVRMRLAETIRWIVAQRLVPKKDGGRTAVLDIITTSLRIRELILHGESEERQFYLVQNEGKTYGMQTFDQHLIELYRQGMISEETAKSYCSRRSFIGKGLDQVKSTQGIATSDLGNLEVEQLRQYSEKPQVIMPTGNLPRPDRKGLGSRTKNRRTANLDNLELE